MKYIVTRQITVNLHIRVDAKDKESAIEASDDYCDLSDYVGNGRTYGALIGTSNSNVTIEADNMPNEVDSDEIDKWVIQTEDQ